MLKQLIISITAFLLGGIACLYVLAISNNSASMAPNKAWTAAGQKVVELRNTELPATTNTPEPVKTFNSVENTMPSAQAPVVHPKELEIEYVKQANTPTLARAQTGSPSYGLDEESIREAENEHLNGRQLKTIPRELLPPAEDVKFHQEQEAEFIAN